MPQNWQVSAIRRYPEPQEVQVELSVQSRHEVIKYSQVLQLPAALSAYPESQLVHVFLFIQSLQFVIKVEHN
jgi:hypothetical protein